MRYPETQRVPASNQIGGIGYDDAYSWLEDDTEDVRRWQETQNRFACAYLESVPGLTRLRSLVEALSPNAFWCWAPERYGNRWFRQLVVDPSAGPTVAVAASPSGPWRALVDRDPLNEDRVAMLTFWRPSPEGRHFAYGLARPDRGSVAQVIDVDSGARVVDLPPGVTSFAWEPDGAHFYYLIHESLRGSAIACRLFRRALDPQEPPEPQPVDLEVASHVRASSDGRHIVVYGPELEPRLVKDLVEGGGGWVPLPLESIGGLRAVVAGDRVVAVSYENASHGEVVSIPLSTAADRRTWRRLLHSDDTVASTVTPVDGHLVVGEHAAGATRLRILSPDGKVEGQIPLPCPGMVWAGPGRGEGLVAPGRGECTFVFSSLTQPPTCYRYDFASATLEALDEPSAHIDDTIMMEAAAPSVDGTPIPFKVVARKEVDLSVPQPTVLSGYGALNIAWLPAYLFTLAAAWVQLGGVYVHAHLRGGGEFGVEWWQAARKATKQTTFDDLFAIAEWLIAKGHTAPERLGLVGSSAGSLAAAAGLTQRPELFRAVVLTFPVLDLLRCRGDRSTMDDIVGQDLGDPDDPGDAAILASYSPYHRVRPDLSYPAVLLECGAFNRTCPAWHGRKMAARLQAVALLKHPVLLRVRDVGHHPQMTPLEMLDREVEELAFLTAELGLPV